WPFLIVYRPYTPSPHLSTLSLHDALPIYLLIQPSKIQGLCYYVKKRCSIFSTSRIEFRSHSRRKSIISFSLSFQFRSSLRIRVDKSYKQRAALTEILKLSLKPCIGIWAYPSASSNA